jgi:protease-4
MIWQAKARSLGQSVGAVVPTVNRSLGALDSRDGIDDESSGQMRLDRPLGDDARNSLDQMIHDAYRIFVSKVAEARKMEFQRVDEQRGRVWIGSDARDLGLVDTLGDLPGAIEAAAKRAGLDAGSYGVEYVEPELSWPERVLRQYSMRLLANLQWMGIQLPLPKAGLLQRLLAAGEEPWQVVEKLNDPRGLYVLCFCGAG